MTLRLIPKSWLSWDYHIIESERRVAELDISWWRERGEIMVEGVPYKVYREGLMSGAFILESGGTVLARAVKPDAFFRRFLLEYQGKQFSLQAKSFFGRGFTLLDGEQEIGTVKPDNIFTRRGEAFLPDEMPLPVRVFIIWLVIILWKRQAQSDS